MGGGGGTSWGTGGAGAGTAGIGGGCGTSGTGVEAGAGAGSAIVGSTTGGDSTLRGPGTGVFDCSVSGSWVVVFSGTLDSGVLENTEALSAGVATAGGRTVIARLATGGEGAEGLIGCA